VSLHTILLLLSIPSFVLHIESLKQRIETTTIRATRNSTRVSRLNYLYFTIQNEVAFIKILIFLKQI